MHNRKGRAMGAKKDINYKIVGRKCRKCLIDLTEENCPKSFLEWNIKLCRSCENEYATEQYRKNRLIIIERLGNKCECCENSNTNYLSIDHIYGLGHQESKKLRGSRYLKKLKHMENLTEKYRCLCYNCNYCLGFWGKCQHKLILTDSQLPLLNREEQRRLRRIKLRLETMLAYGNKCANCQEHNSLFLTLDHINNNGYMDNKLGKGIEFYAYLKRLGFPGRKTQLQILCHNCNAIKDSELRQRKSERNTIQEIYMSITYSINKELNNQLIFKARQLYIALNDI